MSRIALYPGSFDPLTFGHLDIIARCGWIVDELVIGVGAHHEKNSLFTAEERKSLIESQVAEFGQGIRVVIFSGLVVDAALDVGAGLLIRGLRNGTDFDYEVRMAGMNSAMAQNIETMFLAASPEVGYISSSLVRQIARLGGDITPFVPEEIADAVTDRFKK